MAITDSFAGSGSQILPEFESINLNEIPEVEASDMLSEQLKVRRILFANSEQPKVRRI